MPKLIPVLTLAVMLAVSGCMSAKQHQESLPTGQGSALTAGVVQKEIREGMDQVAVIEALGSPNIVTRDSSGRETFIWDKMSTETAYSKSSGGVDILVLGFVGAAAGGGSAGYSSGAGAASTSQRTLTVIIKFAEGVVDEFSYHSSRF